MFTRIACIATFGLAATLAGCQSTEQRTWLVEGPSNSVMLGMVDSQAHAHDDATGAIHLGAGDALGFQLYMNHVAYVHATGDNGSMYATGAPDGPQE